MVDKTKSYSKQLSEMIRKKIDSGITLQLYIVTGVNSENFTVNIRHTNDTVQTFEQVQIMSLGLSNNIGILAMPNVGDYVIGAFLANSQIPIIIGSIYDSFTSTPDNIPQLKAGEMLVTNKANKSLIFLNENGEMILSTGFDINGNSLSKIRFNSDGSIKWTNKDNYGILVDNDNNVEIRGQNIDFYNTPFS